MDFGTFRAAMMNVPAQRLSTGRKIVYRLLPWNPWQHVFFRLLDQLAAPLRCRERPFEAGVWTVHMNPEPHCVQPSPK